MIGLIVLSDWASGTIKEVPYWREDMTPDEYEIERTYFNEHWEDFVAGKYNPLWKQAYNQKNGEIAMNYKPCKEMKIKQYTVLQFSELPSQPYRKLYAKGKIFDIVPIYDMENCVAIESTDIFLNEDISFIM